MLPDLLQRIRASDETAPAFDALRKRLADVDQKTQQVGAHLNAVGTLTRQSFNTMALGATSTVAGFLTLGAVVGGVQSALDKFGDIADKSAAAGVDAEFFQGIAMQAGLAGVGIDTVSAALNTFNKNIGLADEGRGKLFTSLKAINPELLTMLQTADSQEERIMLVADAIRAAKDETEKAAIATSVWGDAGTSLVAVFADGADAIQLQMDKAKALGLIVDRDLIARADELGDKWDTASQVIDLKVKTGLVALAPLMADLVSAAADFATYIGQGYDAAQGVPERMRATLEAQFETLDKIRQKAADGGFFSELQWTKGGASQRYDAVYGELRNRAYDDLQTGLGQLASRPRSGGSAGNSGSGDPNARPGLDLEWLLGGGGNFNFPSDGMGGGGFGSPVVAGLGNVDSALEESKKNMADWAVAFDAEINATGESMDALARQTEAAWSGTANLVAGAFDAMADLVGTSTAESFELNKKLQMASAITTGISATMAAYKAGWETGPITGPALSLAWGGLAFATAAAKVAAIGATTFGSTSMPSGGGGGGGAAPSAPAAAPAVGQTQGVTINIAPGRYSAQEVAQLVQDVQSHLGTQGKSLQINHINGA